MGTVVMYSTVSVDGFVADEHDQPGPLFDWLTSGDVPLDESGVLKVSQTSYDYTRPYWDQIGATIVGRHVFDLTDGWDGTPPGGVDHVVVVTHRPEPEGWDPEAPFHFVDGVEAAVAKAQELAGDRLVEVAAGEVGGQVLAAGLVDEVRMDVVPVVLGSGKRYFGSVDAQHLLEDPDVVIRGQPGAAPALSGAPCDRVMSVQALALSSSATRSAASVISSPSTATVRWNHSMRVLRAAGRQQRVGVGVAQPHHPVRPRLRPQRRALEGAQRRVELAAGRGGRRPRRSSSRP